MSESDRPEAIHGDLSKRVVVDTAVLPWTPSPSGSVWRKRLHRVGPAESGQVTSIVRYEAGAKFPVHDHPEGEEIFVLDGIFSDEHGDWPAGTWLLNPEGFRHAPFSREGCLLFVKLRQAAGDARQHIELQTERSRWSASEIKGIERKRLAAETAFPDSTWLERWSPGASPGTRRLTGGAEVFVLEGGFSDEFGEYGQGSWLRFPLNSSHHPISRGGCTLYVKYDGLAGLRSA